MRYNAENETEASIRPQALRTKRALESALRNLIAVKSLGSVSVTELAREAGVSRRAFYRHYGNVADVLDGLAKATAREFATFYLDGVATRGHSMETLVLTHFLFWNERRELLVRLLDDGLAMRMQQASTDELFATVGLAGIQDDEEMAAALTFMQGGIWALLAKWANDGFAESPDQMAARCSRIDNVIGRRWQTPVPVRG